MDTDLVTLFAFIVVSARLNTSIPNCSTYALAATLSVTVSLSGCWLLNWGGQFPD